MLHGTARGVELVEVYLTERLPVDEMRRRVLTGLPAGFRLVALEDEWIGAPSLASRVAGAVYRVAVDAGGPCPPQALGEVPAIQVLEWDAERGQGTLIVQVQRDEVGRLGRPFDVIQRLQVPLRVVAATRSSIDLSGE